MLSSHSSASSLLNIPVRFPCQQFPGGYSGALVWKLRKCVISENVGGERSSVRGGMPKGRSEWASQLYIKTSSVVLAQTCPARLCVFKATNKLEKALNRITQSILSSRTPGDLFNSSHWLSPTVTTFCQFLRHQSQNSHFSFFLTPHFKSFILHCFFVAVFSSSFPHPGPLLSMATSMETLPAHLLPLVMEEFPQSLATACVCRAGQREPRLRCVQCGIIEEEEEDCSALEEDQALRSFLQTVESLRRSTRWTSLQDLTCLTWSGLACTHTGNQQEFTSGLCLWQNRHHWCGKRWQMRLHWLEAFAKIQGQAFEKTNKQKN